MSEILLSLFLKCGDITRRDPSSVLSEKELSPGTESANVLIGVWISQHSVLGIINFCCISHLVCWNLLWLMLSEGMYHDSVVNTTIPWNWYHNTMNIDTTIPWNPITWLIPGSISRILMNVDLDPITSCTETRLWNFSSQSSNLKTLFFRGLNFQLEKTSIKFHENGNCRCHLINLVSSSQCSRKQWKQLQDFQGQSTLSKVISPPGLLTTGVSELRWIHWVNLSSLVPSNSYKLFIAASMTQQGQEN